ncbi:MAG: SLC13 family permease [Candidatus Hodarchaeota archaeon]
MLISVLIIIGCFIGVVVAIISEKLNRAIASLIGASITYFILIFIEGLDFSVIVDLLFGSNSDGYVNLHSLILIISMMMIVQISHEAGTFQFIAAKLIKLSGARPIILMIIFCFITVIISAILNNILTVIIIIPLTITVSRILNINPSPYILTQAILVNIGGTIFSISSIPNILITSFAKIEFIQFFFNVGTISLIVFIFTLILFILIYRSDLTISEEGVKVLKEFNVWNVVQNKRLLYQSLISLVILLSLFILIPSSIINTDIIALSFALILVVISRLEPKEIISKIDFELIFYLLGIFVIAGGLEVTGVTEAIGLTILNLGGTSPFIQIILILWFSAYLSATIDNIPITKVLIPVADIMSGSAFLVDKNQIYYSLTFGANWGDNLTPLGDNILVVNIAEQNKRPISFKQFFKLGFVTTNYQLILISIYYILIFNFIIGIIIIISISISCVILFIITRFFPQKVRNPIKNSLSKIRNIIIR